jgi:hypothetical protein
MRHHVDPKHRSTLCKPVVIWEQNTILKISQEDAKSMMSDVSVRFGLNAVSLCNNNNNSSSSSNSSSNTHYKYERKSSAVISSMVAAISLTVGDVTGW